MSTRTIRIRLWAAVAAIALVAGGGVAWRHWKTSSPSPQAVAQALKASKLLGNPYSRMVALYGLPSKTIQSMSHGAGMFLFRGGQITVSFVESHSYQVNYSLSQPLSMSSAQHVADTMLPTDAKLLQTRTGANQQQVLVYQSQSLGQQFSNAWFSDQNGAIHPGIFDVGFVANKQHAIDEIDFTVGNNM